MCLLFNNNACGMCKSVELCCRNNVLIDRKLTPSRIQSTMSWSNQFCAVLSTSVKSFPTTWRTLFPGSLARPRLLELPSIVLWEFRDYLNIFTLEGYRFAVTLTLKWIPWLAIHPDHIFRAVNKFFFHLCHFWIPDMTVKTSTLRNVTRGIGLERSLWTERVTVWRSITWTWEFELGVWGPSVGQVN